MKKGLIISFKEVEFENIYVIERASDRFNDIFNVIMYNVFRNFQLGISLNKDLKEVLKVKCRTEEIENIF